MSEQEDDELSLRPPSHLKITELIRVGLRIVNFLLFDGCFFPLFPKLFVDFVVVKDLTYLREA